MSAASFKHIKVGKRCEVRGHMGRGVVSERIDNVVMVMWDHSNHPIIAHCRDVLVWQ
jgi:hypothetical protein